MHLLHKKLVSLTIGLSSEQSQWLLYLFPATRCFRSLEKCVFSEAQAYVVATTLTRSSGLCSDQTQDFET